MTFPGFQREHDGSLSLDSAVFQALGAASMCWDPPPGPQVFDSDRAEEIGQALLAFIKEERDQPRLGFATTHELTRELEARADVAETIGETWPTYRTVGDPVSAERGSTNV